MLNMADGRTNPSGVNSATAYNSGATNAGGPYAPGTPLVSVDHHGFNAAPRNVPSVPNDPFSSNLTVAPFAGSTFSAADIPKADVVNSSNIGTATACDLGPIRCSTWIRYTLQSMLHEN